MFCLFLDTQSLDVLFIFGQTILDVLFIFGHIICMLANCLVVTMELFSISQKKEIKKSKCHYNNRNSIYL